MITLKKLRELKGEVIELIEINLGPGEKRVCVRKKSGADHRQWNTVLKGLKKAGFEFFKNHGNTWKRTMKNGKWVPKSEVTQK